MRTRAALIITGLIAWQGFATADNKMECITASEEAQSLAAHHRLIAARQKFSACLRDVCPVPILEDCAEQLKRVEASLPSVVLVAMTSDGREVRDVRVAMDGALISEVLDGAAIPVDPGEHRWVFTRADGKTVAVDLVVAEGTKLSRVVATFVVPPALVVTKRAPIPALAWILGGVAVASFGAGGVLGAETLAEQNQLYTTSDKDAFLIKEHVVDVAFGVGIVALGVATWFVITRPRVTVSPRAASVEDRPWAGLAF
jgi:hypothetical protein